MDAAVRELLSEEQYAKLVELRRTSARPNQNGNEENGHSRAEHRRELRQILELTEEQVDQSSAPCTNTPCQENQGHHRQ